MRVTSSMKRFMDDYARSWGAPGSSWNVDDIMPRAPGFFKDAGSYLKRFDDAIFRPIFGSWTVAGMLFGGYIIPKLALTKWQKLGMGLGAYLGGSYLPDSGVKQFLTGTLAGVAGRAIVKELRRVDRLGDLYDVFSASRLAKLADPSGLPQLTMQHARDALHYISPAADLALDLIF